MPMIHGQPYAMLAIRIGINPILVVFGDMIYQE
jgi:hypothetical protein